MYCRKCGNQFEGNYCPMCGEKAVPATNQEIIEPKDFLKFEKKQINTVIHAIAFIVILFGTLFGSWFNLNSYTGTVKMSLYRVFDVCSHWYHYASTDDDLGILLMVSAGVILLINIVALIIPIIKTVNLRKQKDNVKGNISFSKITALLGAISSVLGLITVMLINAIANNEIREMISNQISSTAIMWIQLVICTSVYCLDRFVVSYEKK